MNKDKGILWLVVKLNKPLTETKRIKCTSHGKSVTRTAERGKAEDGEPLGCS